MRAAAGLLLRLMRETPRSAEGDADLLERYALQRDEAAFAELVQRYAGLVWSVCRRQLRQQADAEDAFQAVFLILAKKPHAVRNGAALPAWLHGTAYRTAVRLRQRRPTVSLTEPTPTKPESSLADGLALLDEELSNLPEKLRRPLVACYLREQTQDEAAASLGISASTLKRRLERGRNALRLRLERRGFELGAILMVASMAPSLPAFLPSAILSAALTGIVPAGVQSLVNGAIHLMWQTKLRAWAVGSIVATSAATGTGLVALDGQGPGGIPGGPGGGAPVGPPPGGRGFPGGSGAGKTAEPKLTTPKAEPAKPTGEPRKLTEPEKDARYEIEKSLIQIERAELAIKMGEELLKTASLSRVEQMVAADRILQAKEDRLTAQRKLKRAETELAEFAKYFGDRAAYATPSVPPIIMDLRVTPNLLQPQTELDKLLEERAKAADDWMAMFDDRYKDMMSLQSITPIRFVAAVDMSGKQYRAHVEWKNDPQSIRGATIEYVRRLDLLHQAAYVSKLTEETHVQAGLYVKYELLNARILLKRMDAVDTGSRR